jgi:uncharacterized damage-inducible protein DinB
MTYYGAKELADAFRTVRKNTLIIAEEIPETKYSHAAAPDTRSVGKTLVHIALSTRLADQIHAVERRRTLDGFDFPAFMQNVMAEEAKPRTKAEIIAMLRENGDRFAAFLDGVSDDFLAERVAFPAGMTPPSKTRFEMLLGVKEHEMHHRGQLMLMERMLGIVPHLTRDMQARIAAMQAQAAAR